MRDIVNMKPTIYRRLLGLVGAAALMGIVTQAQAADGWYVALDAGAAVLSQDDLLGGASARLLESLPQVRSVYQTAAIEPVDGGLVLKPSPPSIARKLVLVNRR